MKSSAATLKVIALLALLVMVFWAMQNVSSQGVAKFFENMGMPLAAQNSLNLCISRIVGIGFSGKAEILEVPGERGRAKWVVRQGASERELNYISVEKWLGTHCRLAMLPSPALAEASDPSFLSLKFVNGESRVIERLSGTDVYRWAGSAEAFASPELTEAAEQLKKLAAITEP